MTNQNRSLVCPMSQTNHSESPRRLGDFEIVREIGRGGMGVVYEARQVSLNRKVALKVLSGGLGLTPKAVQRFRREAEAAAKLHHTYIVPVYATGEQVGTHFYAMELIDGPSLDHVIRQMRQAKQSATSSGEPGRASAGSAPSPASPPGADATPLANLEATGPYVGESSMTSALTRSSLSSDGHYFDTVARMIAEVADALDYAHTNGVVHRDMKPSNLLLSPAGRLSVNDSGLARMLEQPGMTLTGEFVGTPRYMSPEQITAGRTPLDHRTDIYSLGATLYELLTLHAPFSGERRDQVLAQILHKEPKPPRKVNPKVPVDLETICLKAMEKDPDRRYQTAGGMAEDLRRYVNRFAIAARRAGPAERLRKWAKRHPGLTVGAALTILAGSIAAFFAFQAWRARQDKIASEAAARQQLLQEKMQQALQNVLQGDFSSADDAIDAAGRLGAPEEWMQWRRGQIAYHRSDFEKAVELLESAVAKMPDNVAARCLLASAYLWTNSEGAFQTIARFDSLVPKTPEDYLYKGLIESYFDPIQGLKTLDEAIARHSSLIAHVTRATARARFAWLTGNLTGIQQAMQDAAAAKGIFQGSPAALGGSVYVHHYAALLFEQSRKIEQRDAALRSAREDADQLKAFPDLPSAVYHRGVFLADCGFVNEALEVFEGSFRRKQTVSRQNANYAWLLFERGESEKAAEIIEHFVPAGIERDGTLAFVVAELPDGPRRARKICEAISGEPAELVTILHCSVLHYLGEKDAACDLIRRFRPRLERYPQSLMTLYRNQIEYLKNPDEAAAEKWLATAGLFRSLKGYMHPFIGLTRLGEGNRAAARRQFEAGHLLRDPYYPACHLNRAFLARMDQDPAWPPWIPVQE
jgi:serine/threonine protein kinase